MRVVLVTGTTRTAAIEGISAAGADPAVMVHTPAADAELVAYGRPVRSPTVPVSPTGTPTPALVTRAVRELLGFDLLVLDAGLAAPTGAPTVALGTEPGADIREPVPVPAAESVVQSARTLATALPDEEVVIAESIPGGTTTALGVLRALGEPFAVSSSLPTNPLALKDEVVRAGLEASGLAVGDADGQPVEAIRAMGDPVLAAVVGFLEGTADSDTAVTLAGGTQMTAAAALARHAGVEASLGLATTSFLADDESVNLGETVAQLDLELTVTDPGFDRLDHQALAGYLRGEAKEGVGMGGALRLADAADVSMAAVRQRTIERYESVVTADGP